MVVTKPMYAKFATHSVCILRGGGGSGGGDGDGAGGEGEGEGAGAGAGAAAPALVAHVRRKPREAPGAEPLLSVPLTKTRATTVYMLYEAHPRALLCLQQAKPTVAQMNIESVAGTHKALASCSTPPPPIKQRVVVLSRWHYNSDDGKAKDAKAIRQHEDRITTLRA